MKRMKINHRSLLTLTFMLIFLGTSFHTLPAQALVGSIVKQGIRSLGSMGARKAGQKGLQKGAQKGLQKGAQKGMGQATRQGGKTIGKGVVRKGAQAGVQKVAGQAPLSATVSKAVQALPKNQQGKALNALRRSPKALAKTVDTYGPRALAAELKVPGVGGKFVEVFGKESFQVIEKASTGQLIRLSRHTNKIQTLTPAARSEFLKTAARMPEKVLTTLEKNPNILQVCKVLGITGIVVAGAKEVGAQAFRGETETIQPDGTIIKEHGAISFNMDKTTEALQTPLTAFFAVLGIIVAAFGIHRFSKRRS